MATPKVAYNFDKEAYMHGYCQYFAFEAQKMYGGKICLWLDLDEMTGKERLCHAFLEIAPGFCLDAYGVFSSLDERKDEFEYNYINVVSCTHKEAEEVLKRIKLKYTDSTLKKNVREYLRNNMLTFDYFQNGYTYTMGICAITDFAGTECVLTYSYDMTKKVWGSYIHRIPLDAFVANIQKVYGFIPNKGWYYKR